MSEDTLTRPEIEPTSASPTTSGPDRRLRSMRRYRRENPRLDYYPTPEARAAIAEAQKAFAGYPARAVLDFLIVTGFKAFSGKGAKGK